MLDVRSSRPFAWDPSLKPIGEGSLDKEPFTAWWARHRFRLPPHLPSDLVEQWVFRHWRNSPYSHLPLEQLDCKKETWTTQRFLHDVAWCDPESDEHAAATYGVFNGKSFEPGKTMDAKLTWTIPPIMMDAPDGVLTDDGPMPSARYWLIEGHQRRRYLHALAYRNEGAGKADAPHDVYVLTLTGWRISTATASHTA